MAEIELRAAIKNISTRDFLNEVSLLVSGLRRDIQAKQLNLDASPKARAARRRRVLKDGDFKFFAYTYFPHHIWGEQSKFQKQICERFPKLLRMVSGLREWWKAPRGEAKSTLLTKIGPVYIAVQALLERESIRAEVDWQGDPPPFNDYIIFLGAELRMPTKLMEVVKIELTANAMLELDFPEVCGRGEKWKIGEIITKTGVMMEPRGADQAIRGTFFHSSRPKVLFGDDLITDKEAKSPTERDNRWNWLENSIDYLGPPDGSVKYLGVGTQLNKDDPISRADNSVGHIVHSFKAIETMPDRMDLWEQCEEIMRNQDKQAESKAAKAGDVLKDENLPSFKFYQQNKKAMDKGAVTSWPAVRSLFWLMRQRVKNKKSFEQEMQGNARSDEDKVFTEYQFWVSRLPHWIPYGSCDPSMGKGETSDPSAILVGFYCNLNKPKLHVEHADIKRRVTSKLEADLIRAQREYGCVSWAFENNNAYEYMRTEFMKNAAAQKVVMPLAGITATVPPEVRIESLEPFICDVDPQILFLPKLTRLTEELDDWPEKQTHHHFDGLVALHLLWYLVVTRGGGIPKITSTGRSNSTNMRGY